MSAIEQAVVQVHMADGGFTHTLDRGRFVGGGFAWESDKRWFRDYNIYQPTDAQLTPAQRAGGAPVGVTWEEGLQGLILSWQMVPQNIDLDFWFGPETKDPKTGQWGRWNQPAKVGEWRVIQPGGNYGTTCLQQYKVSPDRWELPSYAKLPANPKFTVSLYREWTPGGEEIGATGAPYIYTGFSFGGSWHLRFPKWKPAELYKLVGGKWKPVASHDWSAEELYGDSYGQKEIYATVWAIDGKLLIKSSANEDSWVYQEDKPISVKPAPLVLAGNGGAAYFGKHGIEFAQGEWNLLVARDKTTLDRQPAAMPESIVTGSKLPNTYARAYPANDDGSEITKLVTEDHNGKKTTKPFRLGVSLSSADGKDTPVVRCAGLNFPPVNEAGPQNWLDATPYFVSAKGGWSCDLEERFVKQQFSIIMDNDDRFFANVRANKLIKIHLGRPGTTSWASDGPRIHLTCVCAIDEHDDSSLASPRTTVSTIDGLDILEEIEIGERPPCDGWLVCDAIREALSWGHVRPEQIAEIYNSGARLPASSWAMTRALQRLEDDVSGDLDADSGAACRLRPTLSVAKAIRFFMNFDYGTFALFDEMNLFRYGLPRTTVSRVFTVTEAATAEDEIRRTMSRRPRLREGKTSVIVGGRDRSTGRPISSRACDYDALTKDTNPRFRGWDVTERDEDDNLNEQRLLNLRCRHKYDWARRLRDNATFGLIGQTLVPLSKVTITGDRDYYVLDAQDEFDRDGNWELAVDAVVA